jgi:Spy/CpxP family protein refolding chaperone
MNASLPSTFSFARRVLLVTAMGAALAGAAACNSSKVDPTEAAAAPDKAAQPQHTGGQMGALLDAAATLNLRADQQATVDAARAHLQTATAPVREARAKLAAEIAQEVQAGQIDHAKIQPLADQVAAAVDATKPAVQETVQKLHDTLDASQRTALVASLRERSSQRAGHGEMRDHMQQVAEELGLTDAQRASIREQVKQTFAARADTAREERGQMKTRMETLATAFQGEVFDAKALDVGVNGAAGAKRLMGFHGAFLDAAVPVLTPAQREILATKIQQKAQALLED